VFGGDRETFHEGEGQKGQRVAVVNIGKRLGKGVMSRHPSSGKTKEISMPGLPARPN